MTQKQIKFLTCLLENSSTSKAIKAAGISSATAYKWLKDKEFKGELERKKEEMLANVSNYLQNSLAVCCERLMEIVNSPTTSAQVKINAISLIFQNARAFTEQAEIMERMRRIEETLEEREEE